MKALPGFVGANVVVEEEDEETSGSFSVPNEANKHKIISNP
jgi:hypothetical protein